MKLTVDQLRVGDKLRFPNGDVWEVWQTRVDGVVLKFKHGTTYFNPAELASILSAVEVDRKPEKVTFTMKVGCRGQFLAHAVEGIIELEPGLYKVEVTPEKP